MPRNECRHAPRDALHLADAHESFLGDDRLTVSADLLKTAKQTPQARLSYLLLELILPLPHAEELLHLGLVVLPPEPLVGPPVHALGLLREWLHHVRATSEALLDGLCLVECPVHRVIPLAPVSKVMTVATQEVASGPIQ